LISLGAGNSLDSMAAGSGEYMPLGHCFSSTDFFFLTCQEMDKNEANYRPGSSNFNDLANINYYDQNLDIDNFFFADINYYGWNCANYET
jgi:hypothetical protein